MAVPEEIRTRLSRWCAARVSHSEREQRQISYTIQGREVTILDRRTPTYPELGAAWSSTAIAQLRLDDPTPGMWSLYSPAGSGWRHKTEGADPIALLDLVSA
ncbi:DUF3024 domain-containing protein [Pseudonocardia nigra]|uniref:DUF3024 domain-containing protein n=1 Tax=Pseudonocardia nigra TaxID=1921578 RepID=UPI001C5F66EC|nr:hypothetical protein [Pseudonocardia nigra]